MSMFARSLLMNPFTDWLGKYVKAKFLEYKNRGKSLRIGYMSYSKNCHFGNRVTLHNFVNMHNATVGDFSYIADRTRIKNAKVGKFCSIGPDCRIGLGRHPVSTFVSTHPIFFSPDKQAQITFADKSYFAEFAEIDIGNDVWIGANVIVIDGVTISDGAIAAAGSVVTKDVPPYAIVAGVPAKIIKYRFSIEIIEMLLELRWWNRDVDYLKKNHRIFHDVEKLRASLSK